MPELEWSRAVLNWWNPDWDISENWLEYRIDADWVAAIRVVAQDGQPVVAELRVFPLEPPRGAPRPDDANDVAPGRWSAERVSTEDLHVPAGGLTARLLRKVRLPVLTDTFAHSLGMMLRESKTHDGGVELFDRVARHAGFGQRQDLRGGEAATHPGRDRGDTFYAQIAATYAAVWGRGSRSPNRDTAVLLSQETDTKIAADSVRGWVLEARRRGLLTRPYRDDPHRGRGRPGGQVTQKALKILSREA